VGQFKLVTSRKGRATFSVRVDGVAAHAGGDHARGANAIVELAKVIDRLAALTDYDAGVTVNVGTIAGGTVINRVPHAAQAELEMRSFTMEGYQRTKAAILAIAGEGSVRTMGGHACRISVELEEESHPWPSNDRSDALFAYWQAAGARLNQPVLPQTRGGLSDGNVLWDAFPTLDGLGPVGDHSHCSEQSADGRNEQEWVDAESFVPKALLNATAIVDLLTQSGEC
jgi:glutamate carboxypeptidase